MIWIQKSQFSGKYILTFVQRGSKQGIPLKRGLAPLCQIQAKSIAEWRSFTPKQCAHAITQKLPTVI